MEIGDIIFVHGNGVISSLIEFFDKGRFSHVCMVISDDNKIIESQYFENTHIISNPYTVEESTILSLNLTDEQKQKLIDIAPSYLEDKYDFKQIIGLLLHDIWKKLKTNDTWNNPNELICSELIVDLLYSVTYLSDSEYEELKDSTPNSLFVYLYNRLKKAS